MPKKKVIRVGKFTRLYAKIFEEDGAFTVSVRLVNHLNEEQSAWGVEIARSIEQASSMVDGLAREFSIPQKCISITITMANLRDGTLH